MGRIREGAGVLGRGGGDADITGETFGGGLETGDDARWSHRVAVVSVSHGPVGASSP